MIRTILARAFVTAAIVGLSFAVPGAHAQDAKPLRLVVPFPAGGATDAVARRLAASLSERMKQNVIVENRGGSGTVIGTQAVLTAPPDGSSILFSTGAVVQAPLLLKAATWDASRDFTLLAPVALVPVALSVPASLGPTTMKELVAWLKARPGQASYGTVGNGSTGHIYGEEMKRRLGLDVQHVPYAGEAAAMPDLISNRIQMYFSTVTVLAPLEQQGKVRILGVTGTQRLPFLPDLPTMGEQGVPGLEAVGWFAAFVPAKVPKDVSDRLRREIDAVVRSPEFVAFLQGLKLQPPGAADMATELPKVQAVWTRLIRDNGIKVD